MDRDKLINRELLKLDQLQQAFVGKAMVGDVAAGSLLLRIYERRATLLGLNPPLGHAVSVVDPGDGLAAFDQVRARVLGKIAAASKPDDDDKLN